MNRHANPAAVEMVLLEQLMAERSLEWIDLLKLDCEGAEYSILYECPAACLDRIGAIALEAHRGEGENESREGMRRYLGARGFETRTGGRDLLTAWRRGSLPAHQ